MSATPVRLGPWDYATGSLVVATATGIGMYQTFSARKNRNMKKFLVTNSDLNIAPLILSIAATFTSAGGLLGHPKEIYNNGASYMAMTICLILLIPLGIVFHLPLLYNLGFNSIFEYLEARFNRSVRLCASILHTFRTMMIASVSLYAPALALNQVTGLHLWASVGLVGFICIIYTSLGGIKAVVWADVTQYLVMIAVYSVILFKGTVDLGGIAEIWRICTEGKRSTFFILKESPYSAYSFWTIVIGGTFHFLAVQTTNQYYMQRYLCNRTLSRAKISFIGGSLTISVFASIIGFGGLLMYARYHDCDPLINGQVTSRDQIMALFAMETLGFCKGLPGIFVAALLCATLSTLSSLLNALATITMEDYIKPCFPKLSEAKQIKLSIVVATAYGVVCIALVLVVENIEGIVQIVFAINGIIGGPVFTIFTIGMALPWVNSWGAIAAFLGAFLLAGWANIGSHVVKPAIPHAPYSTTGCNTTSVLSSLNHTGILENYGISDMDSHASISNPAVFPLYTLSSLWYTIWSLGVGVVIAVIVSILSGPRKPCELDPKLLFPITQRLCSHLPERYQKLLGYDIDKKYLKVASADPENSSINQQQNGRSPATEIPLRDLEAQLNGWNLG